MKFLWKICTTDKALLQKRATLICATAVHPGETRITTSDTLLDWLKQNKLNLYHSYFCCIEQPYIRPADQLRWSILTSQASSKTDLIQKIQNLKFYCNISEISPNFSSC